MDKFLDAIIKFFKALFSQYKIEPIDEQPMGTISHIPKYGEKSKAVGSMQKALKVKGYNLIIDDDFGNQTKAALSKFQKDNGMKGSGIPGPKTIKLLNLKVVEPEPQEQGKKSKIPWFWALKKYEGKSEHDSTFNKFMSGFWAKVGLPNYKSIVGSARAWCGLFGAAGLIMAGYQVPVNSFRAKAWDNYCQKVDFKKNGAVQGTFLRINNKGDCNSVFDNHLTQLNGDCTAEDFNKSGAVVSAFGGNQGDKAKVSNYAIYKICAARWPCEEPLPGKVTKSLNCSNGKTADNESTR